MVLCSGATGVVGGGTRRERRERTAMEGAGMTNSPPFRRAPGGRGEARNERNEAGGAGEPESMDKSPHPRLKTKNGRLLRPAVRWWAGHVSSLQHRRPPEYK